MNKKIIFYNTENNGRYEYEASDVMEYGKMKKEIEEDIATAFMGDGSLKKEIHLCKFGDEEPVNVTHKLIRINQDLKFRYSNFSLDEYIEKYSDNCIELALIDTDKYLRKLDKNMIVKFISVTILVVILLIIYGVLSFTK